MSSPPSSTPPSSSDDDCPVCLNGVVEKAKTDACNHFFCFECLKKCAVKKRKCPLCRTPFKWIIYAIVSDTEFKKFDPMPSVIDAFNPGQRAAFDLVSHFLATQDYSYLLSGGSPPVSSEAHSRDGPPSSVVVAEERSS